MPAVVNSSSFANSAFITQGIIKTIKAPNPAAPAQTKVNCESASATDIKSIVDVKDLLSEACDPHVGGLILELANLKDVTFSPVSVIILYRNEYVHLG